MGINETLVALTKTMRSTLLAHMFSVPIFSMRGSNWPPSMATTCRKNKNEPHCYQPHPPHPKAISLSTLPRIPLSLSKPGWQVDSHSRAPVAKVIGLAEFNLQKAIKCIKGGHLASPPFHLISSITLVVTKQE